MSEGFSSTHTLTSIQQKQDHNTLQVPTSRRGFHRKRSAVSISKICTAKVTDSYAKQSNENSSFCSESSHNLVSSYADESKYVGSSSEDANISPHPSLQNFDPSPFPCYFCKASGCGVCGGSGKVSLQNSLVKFMGYVMDFKMGKVQSWRGDESEREKEKGVLQESGEQERKNREVVVHYGFMCNGCAMDPIQGVRYSCKKKECGGDFDLCGMCYRKEGHQHDMEQRKNSKSWGEKQKMSMLLMRMRKARKESSQILQ